MGEVYRVVDTRLGRQAAVKVLPQSLLEHRERIARFEREARAASALNHPNIVTIYETGSGDFGFYIAMEMVEGRTLREMLRTGPIPLRRLLPLAAQVADGLAKAHEAGIVHRDLKPDNLMVTKDGFVKILDFGLAKLSQAAEDRNEDSRLATMTEMTEPGAVLGTAGYMSPEQASGRTLDFRSDQFSLGSILYEMATGRRAFERPTAVQTLTAIIQDEPEAMSKVNPKLPVNLCWLVERCLAKEPEDRYAATRDLARDLAALRDHASDISVVGLAGSPLTPRVRISRAVGAAMIVAAVVGLAAFFAGQKTGIRRGLEAPGPRSRPLTFLRGYITGARFAPDGQNVIYSASWDGRPSEIFQTRIDSPESRPLGIFPAGILAVSSTGEMAISIGCEDRWDLCFGTLARAPLSGGAARDVLEDVASADWSPDGKELAVIHVVEGKYRLEFPIGKVLYRTEGFLSHVRVSPRGDRVAFFAHPGRDSQRGVVSVVDRNGLRKDLTGEYAQLGDLLWGKEGDEIYFAAGSHNYAGKHQVRSVSLSGRIRATPWVPGLLDVSRDGKFLQAENPTRADIVGLVPGATGEQSFSWLGWSQAADLSTDGRTLLFFEAGPAVGRVFTTYRRKTDGSQPIRLGEGKALALSPDEKWALTVDAVPSPHLVLLPMGVGEPRPLPAGGIVQYHWAFFFPDGRRIGFAGEESNHRPRSYVQDVEGGAPRPFGEEGMRISAMSPNGREIAGSTEEGAHFIFSADGGRAKRPIAGTEPGDFLVRWSADGKSLFLRGPEERPLTLYRVDLGTGKRERWRQLAPLDVAGFLEYGAGPRGALITPDGKSYVYTYWSRLGQLFLFEGLEDRWK